ncbi:MAG: dienelactone hydrolase family protein [Gammaproteobacteria bacterium]
MEFLPAIEIETRDKITASVIWLHGLGADGHDFEPVISELKLPESIGVRFILPHAPIKTITINGGMQMRAWFDILEHGERHIDVDQLMASSAEIHKLIDREVERGVASEQVVLVGFSQGGAVCLQAGLTFDKPLAGILGLSTFFPTAEVVEPHPANTNLPIQIYHGSEDPLLPEWMAKNTIKYLGKMGYQPVYKSYPMTHSVCSREIADIAQHLQSILI